MMTTLYEKIAKLPPSLLPRVERFVDSLPANDGEWDELDYSDPDWGPPPVGEEGKPKHPQPGCMKGIIVMHDNFFEPDDVWEEYM
jgi:hypothetical protein